MILSICPNPSIDFTVELDSLNVGRLNRIRAKEETYSGKGLNVAKGIARLNKESFATGFMFSRQGKLFEESLDKDGVKHEFVYKEGSARLNYKVIDNKSMLTEINDKGEVIPREKQLELIELVRRLSENASVVVMSGSLPSGVSPEFYREVMEAVPNTAKKIIDAERKNMEEALKCGAYLVKPNLDEFCDFTGEKITSHKDIVRLANKYVECGAKLVLVSLGSDGAVLTDGKEGYYCKSASVAVNSAVGAGDSMVAAAAVALENGDSLKEILKSSVAAGTASVTTSGTNLFYKDKYDEIYSKIFVEEI